MNIQLVLEIHSDIFIMKICLINIIYLLEYSNFLCVKLCNFIQKWFQICLMDYNHCLPTIPFHLGNIE